MERGSARKRAAETVERGCRPRSDAAARADERSVGGFRKPRKAEGSNSVGRAGVAGTPIIGNPAGRGA